MKNLATIRTKIIIGISAGAAFLAPFVVRASALDTFKGQVDTTGKNAGLATEKLSVIVGRYLQQILALTGIILVVFIVYAGFLWMTAQGDTEKVKKAKGILSTTIVGMILIFAAYAITTFVTTALREAGA